MLFCPLKGHLRHLCLQRVFIFAPAVFTVICHRLVIITLNAVDVVFYKKVHDLVHERSISSHVPKVVYVICFNNACLMVGSLEGLNISMNVTEYPSGARLGIKKM